MFYPRKYVLRGYDVSVAQFVLPFWYRYVGGLSICFTNKRMSALCSNDCIIWLKTFNEEGNEGNRAFINRHDRNMSIKLSCQIQMNLMT